VSTVIAGDRTFPVRDYFDDDKTSTQEALRLARERNGYAACACVQPPRRLVIREIRGTCYLALWPNDGHFHDEECPFHRPDPAPSAAETTQAVKLNSEGQWDIALDGAQRETQRMERNGVAAGAGHNDPPSRQRRAHLSIEQLLHWLWHSASLNRWDPRWKRDWWRIERSLTSTSSTVVVAGESLSQLLYIPPAFRRDREAAIRSAWEMFSTRLKPDASGARSTALLIGHLKDIDPSPYGYRLAVRHFANRLYVDPSVYAALAKQGPLALSMVKMQDRMRCAVLGIFEVEMSLKGYLHVRDGALMLAGERFVNVNNLHELALVNALTGQGRRFERPSPGANLCDFLLLDTARPTALEVSTLDSKQYRAMKQKREAASLGRGCDVWRWHTSQTRECPPLPAPR